MYCHVLPSIDDGATDEKASLETLQEYVSLGHEGTIAGPHIMEGYYDNTSKKIDRALQEFITIKNSRGLEELKITAAAAYKLDSGFNELLEKSDTLPVHRNRVLVKFSYFQKPSQADRMLFSLKTQKLNPILAHLERYNYLKDTS
jgi:tyrosine-protein phosphatase YwqE